MLPLSCLYRFVPDAFLFVPDVPISGDVWYESARGEASHELLIAGGGFTAKSSVPLGGVERFVTFTMTRPDTESAKGEALTRELPDLIVRVGFC